jgi:hypothetical protein
MKAIRTAWVLSVGLTSAALAATAEYRVLDRIKVTDGGFDYATFDPATQRVYVARADDTTVLDVKTGKTRSLSSAGGAHIALAIPGTTLIALTERKGSVKLVDTASDKELADIPAGKNPDGMAYDPSSKLLFAMNHDSGDATLVDPVAKKAVATIPVGGELEFPAPDGAGKVFVNVEDRNEIAVIDVKARAVTARYTLAGCDRPTGLAYAASMKLLISSCGGNGVAKIVRAADGTEVTSLAIAKGADAVMYDAKRNLAFIPCRDGMLEVLSLSDPGHISVIQHVPTQIGSRTGTLDPGTGRVYMMAAKFRPPAAPGGRPQALPGTFEVLVAGP